MKNNISYLIASSAVALTFILFIVHGSPASPSVSAAPAAAVQAMGSSIKSIAVLSEGSLDTLKEGDVVHFRAILLMADGSQRSGEGVVQWLSLGYAGSIDKNGTFTAHLDPTVSELGRAPGVVVALYKTAAGTTTILGASSIFNVSIQDDTSNLPG